MIKMRLDELDNTISEDEILELKTAQARANLFDDHSREMTPEMLTQLKNIQQHKRAKQTISIRLSEKALQFSKSYGKGYTSFLSRLIDAALDDADLVKKCI